MNRAAAKPIPVRPSLARTSWPGPSILRMTPLIPGPNESLDAAPATSGLFSVAIVDYVG